jgi:hypothetical protein
MVKSKSKEVKFVAKVAKLSGDRSIIAFPEKFYDEGKKLRGKDVKVTIEEIIF